MASLNVEGINNVRREILLATTGNGSLCRKADRETPHNCKHRMYTLRKCRNWRPQPMLRMDDMFICGKFRRAWRDIDRCLRTKHERSSVDPNMCVETWTNLFMAKKLPFISHTSEQDHHQPRDQYGPQCIP